MIDFPIRRLVGGRVLPSEVAVSGVEFWLRAQPGGGFTSPLSSPGAEANAAGSPVARAGTSPSFTLSSLPVSAWLRVGEKTRMAIAGFQLHVLPAVPETAVWNAPILGLDGLLTGRSEGMAARIVLRNGSGSALIESEADLFPGAETVASTDRKSVV